MSYLLRSVAAMPISTSAKMRLLQVITPTADRTYCKMGDDSLDKAQRDEMIRQYSNVFHTPADQVVLFGFTNPEKKRTVLLPAFYELPSVHAQAAALLHESLWILAPLGTQGMTYPAMVKVEKSALDYFDNPEDPNTVFMFYKNLAIQFDFGIDMLLKAAVNLDTSHPSTPSRIADILGDDFLSCYFLKRWPEVYCEDPLKDFLLTTPEAQSSLFPQALRIALDQGSEVVMPKLGFSISKREDLERFENEVSFSLEMDPNTEVVFIVLAKNHRQLGRIKIVPQNSPDTFLSRLEHETVEKRRGVPPPP